MPIDEHTIALLKERIQNAKDGTALTHFPVRWNVVEALLTAASNEARLQREVEALRANIRHLKTLLPPDFSALTPPAASEGDAS